MQAEKRVIVVVELNHHNTPIAIRESVSKKSELIKQAIESQTGPNDELLYLTTCNRFTVYCYCTTPSALMQAFQVVCGAGVVPYLTIHQGKAAVHHMMATASGLESQTLGEHEILGQIRRAYRTAQEEKKLGPILHELASKAIYMGKRARTETAIGQYSVSLSAIACHKIALATKGQPCGPILVFGTGDMARAVLYMLEKDQLGPVYIVSRNLARAQKVAKRHHAIPLDYLQAEAMLPKARVLIGATTASSYLFPIHQLKQPDNIAPLLMIDLGLPRNFDAAAGQLPGVTLCDLDTLKSWSAKAMEQRQKAARHAWQLVGEETESYDNWYRFRTYVPLIKALKQKLEEEKSSLLQEVLPGLGLAQQQIFEQTAQRFAQKSLSQMIALFRKLNDEGVVLPAHSDENNHRAKVIQHDFRSYVAAETGLSLQEVRQ